MVTHRWWGNKFCKRTCKHAYLRELALDRDRIRRWYGFASRWDRSNLSPPHAHAVPCKTSFRARPRSELWFRRPSDRSSAVQAENLIGRIRFDEAPSAR